MPARDERKIATHEKILAAAGRLVRQEGLAAASVVRVMRGAGLTIGGFYAHFRSKRAMDKEVMTRALAEMRKSWFAGLESSDGLDWLARAMKRYLSPAHRDHPAFGCPMPAALSELSRADRPTREALAESFEQAVAAFAEHAPATADTTSRERALAALTLCVGGITLARALRGSPVSDELLRACVKWALPETGGARR